MILGVDLNFAVDGEAKAEGYVQVDLNMHAKQGSAQVLADFRYQNYHKIHSAPTELDHDGTRRTKIDNDEERTQSLNQGVSSV